MMQTLLSNEQGASTHRGHYEYMSEERSDRTGGHLWVEKVVETAVGRVRFLVGEDGQPASPERIASERSRLAQDVAHPDDFAKREAAQANDEQHAKQMLALLPKAFLFDAPADEGASIRITYRPNPDYQPSGMEERVLHAMNGFLVIDKQKMRLREVMGRLDGDCSLGFGPFAIIKAGSNFDTVRQPEDGSDWKTKTVHSDIVGRALLMKTLGRKQDLKRWDYTRVDDALTLAQAVELVER